MKVFTNSIRIVNNSSSSITALSLASFYNKEIGLKALDTLFDEIDFDFRRFTFDMYDRRHPENYKGAIKIRIGEDEYSSIPDPHPTLWKHSGMFEVKEGHNLRYSLTLQARGRFADFRLTLIDAFSTNDWMRSIHDAKLLTELALPGTHDSSSYLNGLPYVNTQTLDFTSQLNAGVRFLDIRVGGTINNYWHLFHGNVPLGDYDIFVHQLSNFLAANPSETVVVSIKQDSDLFRSSANNLEIFKRYLERDTHLKWFIENRIPALGEVRGKAVFLRRFEVAAHEIHQALGIQASSGWGDNTDSLIDLSPYNEQALQIQDRYTTDDPFAKYNWANEYIGRSSWHNSNLLYLNFFSAYGGILGWFPFTLGTPGTIATGYYQWYWDCGPQTRFYDGVNDFFARQLDYINSSWYYKPRGIMIMDYPESNELPRRVIQLNGI